jgi:hypothetical protein
MAQSVAKDGSVNNTAANASLCGRFNSSRIGKNHRVPRANALHNPSSAKAHGMEEIFHSIFKITRHEYRIIKGM